MNNIVKIKCPKCKEDAELTPDFSFVTCTKCDFDMTYGEYVKFVAHSEAKYSDILGDYTAVSYTHLTLPTKRIV